MSTARRDGLAVAWAGETGEGDERRLGWWRSDLVSEFGGMDLLRRLTTHTWEWAVFQAAREVGRRKDAELRARDADPDRVISLFHLGFELDERAEERLQALKGAGGSPVEALPALGDLISGGWSRDAFRSWVRSHGEVESTVKPAGRRIRGAPPENVSATIRMLVGGWAPLAEQYSLPHLRRDT